MNKKLKLILTKQMKTIQNQGALVYVFLAFFIFQFQFYQIEKSNKDCLNNVAKKTYEKFLLNFKQFGNQVLMLFLPHKFI